MPDHTAAFTKLVPGFDFLQGLVKNAGSALPQIGQWVAPTLDPEELGKRIEELRTVQFWLEQNAKMLSVTIQALEVQRMTLSTLKTMNVQVNDLRASMTLPERAAPATANEPEPKQPSPARKTPAAAAPAGVVDPMQWWGALTKQFTELAAGALKDGAGAAATSLAGNRAKQSMDAAQQTAGTTKKAAAKPARRPSKAGAAKPRKAASR